jgi:hypothetical protein
MKTTRFIISEVRQLFNVTRKSANGALTIGSDLRFAGHYEGEKPAIVRHVIVRRGPKDTDLAMKKGEGGWELEILLPPEVFAMFAGLTHMKVKECSFDVSNAALGFQIGSLNIALPVVTKPPKKTTRAKAG